VLKNVGLFHLRQSVFRFRQCAVRFAVDSAAAATDSWVAAGTYGVVAVSASGLSSGPHVTLEAFDFFEHGFVVKLSADFIHTDFLFDLSLHRQERPAHAANHSPNVRNA
jgi:hypothetical protein